ncbi:MAG: biotin/lipoyl-binding carrier protein [Alphaproteobacteria bacterium]|nr:MAG: biotin/lipoyl-binding carrier protein [Alphaproteobacteria bacterium]
MTDVKSEVKGKVWQIEAAPGTSVDEDDPIIILESMKMEIPIVAPRNGVVKALLVEEGDPVEEGQVIATLE